ncbi:P1 family peptidase [Segeticoccus rhizosphaerae]|uniref:P1 family peptidase n=1 Tax=Segeticoccus rhizosphaerae TaxID=1104777 RepID=UPI0010C0B582|nr:P1 family peptidase [Ornithinicoccus soli]
MQTRSASLSLGVLALSAAMVTGLPMASATPSTPNPGLPGKNNAITDVPGIRVGQVQSTAGTYLTGTTVVYTPTMSVASVDQSGGAPATKETDLLSPLNSNPGVNAIQLGGSSMYGLDATTGIIRWLEDRKEGVNVGVGVAPIVPAADIFDLGRGGDIKSRTSAPWGYLAADANRAGPVRQGVVGGGTGARSGGLKSGVGTASVYLGDGIYVGAIVIVNSAGSAVDPRDCSLLGASLGIGDEFDGLRIPKRSECHPPKPDSNNLNTTIAVVATNAPLEKAAAQRMSANANDGLARAINPIHTLADGDTVFAVSTGTGTPLRVNDPAASRTLNSVFNAGANTLSRAVTKALLSARSEGTAKSYCDTYPSACKHLENLESWRNAGTAPDVTPKSFRWASSKLALTPIPRPDDKAPGAKSPAANTLGKNRPDSTLLHESAATLDATNRPRNAVAVAGVGLLGLVVAVRRKRNRR